MKKVCHEDNFPVFFIVASEEFCIKIIANHFPVVLMRKRRIEKWGIFEEIRLLRMTEKRRLLRQT